MYIHCIYCIYQYRYTYAYMVYMYSDGSITQFMTGQGPCRNHETSVASTNTLIHFYYLPKLFWIICFWDLIEDIKDIYTSTEMTTLLGSLVVLDIPIT